MDDLIEWFGETERQIADAEPIICDTEKLRELSRDHKVISFYFLAELCYFSILRYRSLTVLL